MPFRYGYMVPIIASIVFAVTFFTTYLISVSRNDVAPILPYISSTGTFPPASCIFGFAFNLGSILVGIIVYIRYRQVKFYLQKNTFPKYVKKYNWHCLIMGIITALGMSLVGSFQESNVLSVHCLGAFLAFVLGWVYISLQAYISFLLYPTFGDKKTYIARAVCSVVIALLALSTSIFGGISGLLFKGNNFRQWTIDDGGYFFHLISAASEWLLAATLMVFGLLFVKEFRNITIWEPVIDDATTSKNN